MENVTRELQEEIGAVLAGPPALLGRVAPDSGLTAGGAEVYLTEIESYSPSADTHEGISEILELLPDELEALISSRQIDDGFTLSAYALYRAGKGAGWRRISDG